MDSRGRGRLRKKAGTVSCVLILLAASIHVVRAGETGAWSFDSLRQRASELAKKSYAPVNDPPLPEALSKLSYDHYQHIHFRPQAGPWHQSGVKLDLGFMHRGYVFRDPVKIRLLEAGQAREFEFKPELFDYGSVKFNTALPAGIGFAGFKILLNNEPAAKWDEVGSFLGASYFRLVGTRERYGASARALAIDTGEAAGEEFPKLTEFWIEKPGPASLNLQVYGLLDSPSVAGACRFLITPGEQTSAEVELCLYPRNAEKKFGLGALTSMFLVGENRTRYIPDFRPEVHDSDGLLLKSGDGKWLWRPLVNPEKRHRITTYVQPQVAGFGLMQRDRDFRSYEDLQARYELRPSLWIEPLESWGEGRVELVEIPSPNEFNDNIVAYWVPLQKPVVGKELRVRYRISALLDDPAADLERVVATRITPAQDNRPVHFVVDFTRKTLASRKGLPQVQARAVTTRGRIEHLVLQENDVSGGWRAFFDLAEAGNEPAEVRLFLELESKPLTETWVYAYQAS